METPRAPSGAEIPPRAEPFFRRKHKIARGSAVDAALAVYRQGLSDLSADVAGRFARRALAGATAKVVAGSGAALPRCPGERTPHATPRLAAAL